MSPAVKLAPPPVADDAYETAASEMRRRAYVLAAFKDRPASPAKTAAREAHERAAAEWALLHFARLVTKARP